MALNLDKFHRTNSTSREISRSEYEQFEREFLFQRLVGDKSYGEAFCEKFGITDFVLSIIKNEDRAKKHIETFKYVT
jgi:hypothetical protein